MSDVMTETAEETAALTALQNEAPFELVTPEPEAKPEPEPKPEPKPEPEAKKTTARLVNYEALHEERVKRQALERELAELRKPAAPVQSDEIDENENPLGAISALKGKIKAMEQQGADAQRENSEKQEVMTRLTPRIEAYRAEHPEYDDQFQFLRSTRLAEYRALKVYSDPQIAGMIQAEEWNLARHALQNDLDPGEVIKNFAEARGWKPAEVAKEEPKPKTSPEGEAKIARLTAGQRAARSPSAAGGSGPEPEMTLERLNELEGAAFDAAFAKNGKRLLGG